MVTQNVKNIKKQNQNKTKNLFFDDIFSANE